MAVEAWEGLRVVVAGLGSDGFAAADNLMHLGAEVVVVDEAAPQEGEEAEKVTLLELLGADLRLGAAIDALPAGIDLVVASSEWPRDAALLEQARAAGVPVIGEVELAWRMRDPDQAAPWLAVTGTTGVVETARILESMLVTGDQRTVLAGLGGLPLVEVVMDPEPYDAIVVALSTAQLHYAESMSALAAAVLDAPDEDLADIAHIYDGVREACIYNLADPNTEQLVRDADVEEGARAIGITLGTPGVGMLGLVDDVLCDRAFIAERQTSAAEICQLRDLSSNEPHHLNQALAATALARAHGVGLPAIRDALRRVDFA